MIKTALVTWSDGNQTTLGIRRFRKLNADTYIVQFPDWEWEEIASVITMEWM
jgi:hypothetical protein